MLSKTSIHAIKAMVALAKIPDNSYAGAAKIAEQVNAPKNYLGKLLQTLARERLVFSQKGLGGGFCLARDPDEITLYHVVTPIEQVDRWKECILGQRECNDQCACSLHCKWEAVRNSYLSLLQETTIADLVTQHGSWPMLE